MTEVEYTTEVRSILDGHTREARSQLAKLPSLLPNSTKSIDLMIFIDQDGEGFLTVRISLNGPDLYVINKQIEDCAVLFDTVMVSDGLEPPLPLMDPFDEGFSVHDELANCAADWLVDVMQEVDCKSFGVPFTIITEEGYGSKLSLIHI